MTTTNERARINKPDDKDTSHDQSSGLRPYRLLGAAIAVHFVVMFALTYAGVNTFDEIFVNLNRFYMAVLMVASMVLVMMGVMWGMFRRHRLNLAILTVALAVLIGSFAMLRTETFVGNRQFLRSMIPHHSIAIHTCNEADIDDPEIAQLCTEIVSSQKREIAQMREILRRLDEAE